MMSPVLLSLLIIVPFSLLGLSANADASSKKSASVKEVKAMSEKEQTTLALSGAPETHRRRSRGHGVRSRRETHQVKKSENGFTCIPTVMNLPDPDPICMDGAAHQWITDIMNNAPKPSNTIPGIAYMARGGSHLRTITKW